MRTADDIPFKTKDGNDIRIDVIFTYRVDPQKAPYIRQFVAKDMLELKEKVGTDIVVPGEVREEGHLVARDALVELGYTMVDAEKALAAVDPTLPAEERVREALRTAA